MTVAEALDAKTGEKPERDYLGNIIGTELVPASYVADTTQEIMRLKAANAALTEANASLAARCETWHAAMEELVKLYGHYASLLNMADGGARIEFTCADEWLTRRVKLRAALAKGSESTQSQAEEETK